MKQRNMFYNDICQLRTCMEHISLLPMEERDRSRYQEEKGKQDRKCSYQKILQQWFTLLNILSFFPLMYSEFRIRWKYVIITAHDIINQILSIWNMQLCTTWLQYVCFTSNFGIYILVGKKGRTWRPNTKKRYRLNLFLLNCFPRSPTQKLLTTSHWPKLHPRVTCTCKDTWKIKCLNF